MPEPTATPADTPAADPAAAFDAALIDALTAMEQSLTEKDAWNLSPQVYLWQPPVLAGLAVPGQFWQKFDGHPADVLALIADQWDDVKASLIAQDPVVFGQPPKAVALITEAWTLDIGAAIESGDHAKIAEYQRTAENRMIFRHPDRVEARTVAAVDRDLHVVTIVRMRGKPTVVVDVSDGLVPDVMKDFITRVNRRSPAV